MHSEIVDLSILIENNMIYYPGDPEPKLSKYITDGVTNCPAKHFETIEQAVDYIKNKDTKVQLFLKASRSMKFERIIEELK